MRIAILAGTAILLGGCGMVGGGSNSKEVKFSGHVSTNVTATRECVLAALRNVGFTTIENETDKVRIRAIRPRKEILGIPTSDDFDRIDAGLDSETLHITVTTHDGTEAENVSAEGRRDGETVLRTCSDR